MVAAAATTANQRVIAGCNRNYNWNQTLVKTYLLRFKAKI